MQRQPQPQRVGVLGIGEVLTATFFQDIEVGDLPSKKLKTIDEMFPNERFANLYGIYYIVRYIQGKSRLKSFFPSLTNLGGRGGSRDLTLFRKQTLYRMNFIYCLRERSY